MKPKRLMKFVLLAFGILLVTIILVVLGAALTGQAGQPILYEIAGSYKGWVVIQYADPGCPQLGTKGIYLIIPISGSGQACTSTPMPQGYRYERYEYVNPDGRRTEIRSWGWNPKRQIWGGFASRFINTPPGELGFIQASFFVGTRAELERSWATRPTLRDP